MYIKIFFLLLFLIPVLVWPAMCGAILYKAEAVGDYQFPVNSHWPTRYEEEDLQAASRDKKWDVNTRYTRVLQYRMLSTEPNLPLFLAELVKQHKGEVALERDWSNDFDSAPAYTLHARISPALATELRSLDGDDPDSIQAWLDQQYTSHIDEYKVQDSTAVPIRIEFTGPYFEMFSIDFGVKGLPFTAILWIAGVFAVIICIVVIVDSLKSKNLIESGNTCNTCKEQIAP